MTKKLSAEHCAKISAGLLGIKRSAETRARMSAAKRKMSAKTKAKIRAARLAYLARRKAEATPLSTSA
jgi:hypothetical protein